MKILVIIPAYNEESNIRKVVKNMESMKETMDYLVVNDCSTDHTKEILEEIHANHINLPINLGIGGCVQTGYLYALEHHYDIAIQMDGDGQHDCSYLFDLIKPLVDGNADVAIGSRFITKEGFQSSLLRRSGIQFLSKLIQLCCGVTVKDVTSGFRAVNYKMITFFAEDYAQDYPEPEAILSCAVCGATIAEIPVIMHEREGGTSSITSLKSIYYMIKVSMALLLQRAILGKRRKEK